MKRINRKTVLQQIREELSKMCPNHLPAVKRLIARIQKRNAKQAKP